jgi:G3E family GTPase
VVAHCDVPAGADVIQAFVLTGFLGSGKTTLLGRLLRKPEFSRTAVIINEFGDIGLDHDLIEASEDSVIELQAGCLCCKIRNDLAATINDLLSRRDAGTVAPFTRVVIETSGLADPAPILQTLMTDATIADRIVLGSVVTVVDAVNGADTLDREEISAKQVAVADRLLLTKTDLAGAGQSAVMRRIRALNATAPVLTSQHGRVEGLFGGRLYDPLTKSLNVQSWLGAHAGPDEHGHDFRHVQNPHDVETYAIVRREPMPAVALTLFLEAISEHCGADLLRLKGIVNILESADRPAVIHGVQHVFHPPTWLSRWPSDDRRSRIVFITRGIPRGWIEALLAAIESEVIDVSRRISM